jgi:hypothetical protein
MPRLVSFAVAALVCSLAFAQQPPARVRGLVESFDGKTLVVRDAGSVQVGEKTEIVFARPIRLADISPGDFLGVTSRRAADGKLTAYEVRRFPKPLNPGHRPFDGGPNQTMTNASVGTVAKSGGGEELTLTYEGGSQKVTVPQDAAISDLVPGKASQLVPGARVSLTHDGNKAALRVQVSPPR